MHKKIIIDQFLLSTYFKKKKIILRNSQFSEYFIKKYYKNKLDFNKLRRYFYSGKIFSYAKKEAKSGIIKLLKSECSEEISQFIKYAEEVLKHNVQIFDKLIKFENEINWHYGFSENFIWKLEKSENIEIFPKDVEVDVKYVWELNRHQFLIYLGFAYYITNNEKYSREFKLIITNWIKKNPPLYGINWYSGLEISLRLTSWIFTLLFFQESQVINNNKFFRLIFKSMFQHAYFLRYFNERRKLNHTIGDLFGLYFFSKIFIKMKPMKIWETKFSRKLKKQIILQIRDDGTNIEQSVNYHRHVLEFFSLFLIINPHKINQKELKLIEKMYDYLLYIIKPNHTFPLIGDFDDGKILPLTSYEKNPFMKNLNLGSILFQRNDIKYISNKISALSILLLGIHGYNQFINLKEEKPKKKIKILNKAGYFIIRNNWSKACNYLFIDCGRFGPKLANHTHSSITNFIYSYKGKDVIEDSGTYCYNISKKFRGFLRSSSAHNILTVDNNNQAISIPWFGWKNKPKIRRKIIIGKKDIKIFCYHDGYNGFITHRRFEVKQNLKKIIIYDKIIPKHDISMKKSFDININFHFNKDNDIKITNNRFIIDNGLGIEVSSKQNFTAVIGESYYSPSYGVKFRRKVLNIHLKNSFHDNKFVEVKTTLFSLG